MITDEKLNEAVKGFVDGFFEGLRKGYIYIKKFRKRLLYLRRYRRRGERMKRANR